MAWEGDGLTGVFPASSEPFVEASGALGSALGGPIGAIGAADAEAGGGADGGVIVVVSKLGGGPPYAGAGGVLQPAASATEPTRKAARVARDKTRWGANEGEMAAPQNGHVSPRTWRSQVGQGSRVMVRA
jgi:hypothetical protein